MVAGVQQKIASEAPIAFSRLGLKSRSFCGASATNLQSGLLKLHFAAPLSSRAAGSVSLVRSTVERPTIVICCKSGIRFMQRLSAHFACFPVPKKTIFFTKLPALIRFNRSITLTSAVRKPVSSSAFRTPCSSPVSSNIVSIPLGEAEVVVLRVTVFMPVREVFEEGMKRVVKPLIVDIDWRSGWCTLVGSVENSWREIESV